MQQIKDDVLLKALCRVCAALELDHDHLAELPDLDVARSDESQPDGASGGFTEAARTNALHLIRLFQALTAITGSTTAAQAWLQSPNIALGDRPITLLVTGAGIVRVMDYLEASV